MFPKMYMLYTLCLATDVQRYSDRDVVNWNI